MIFSLRSLFARFVLLWCKFRRGKSKIYHQCYFHFCKSGVTSLHGFPYINNIWFAYSHILVYVLIKFCFNKHVFEGVCSSRTTLWKDLSKLVFCVISTFVKVGWQAYTTSLTSLIECWLEITSTKVEITLSQKWK